MKTILLKLGWVRISTMIVFILAVIFMLTVIKSTNVIDILFISIYAAFLFFQPTAIWKAGGASKNFLICTLIAFGWGLFFSAFTFAVIGNILKVSTTAIRADINNIKLFWAMVLFSTAFMFVVVKEKK